MWMISGNTWGWFKINKYSFLCGFWFFIFLLLKKNKFKSRPLIQMLYLDDFDLRWVFRWHLKCMRMKCERPLSFMRSSMLCIWSLKRKEDDVKNFKSSIVLIPVWILLSVLLLLERMYFLSFHFINKLQI